MTLWPWLSRRTADIDFLSACIQSERLHDVAVVLELHEDLEQRGGRGFSTGNRQDAEKDRVSARVSPQGPVCERHAGFWVRYGRSHAAFDLCRPDGGPLSLRAKAANEHFAFAR